MSDQTFQFSLEQLEDYRFQIDFGDMGQLETDEPDPIGSGQGPNPSRLLAAAAANCLAASLLFCVRKFKEDAGTLSVDVTGHITRNARNRLRIGGLDIRINLGRPAEEIEHIARCLAQFEDFCVVTQSIREGVPVNVTVADADGNLLPTQSE